MAQRNQPSSGSFDYTNEWSHGLLACCDDCGGCIKAMICMPCTLCELSEKAGECQWTPICCGFPSLLGIRNKIRGHYKIQGAVWKDILELQCCGFCAILQMKNELASH